MVLVLRENGAQLQLQLALLVHAPVSHRDSLALVEFGIADERDRLLQVKDALFKHANPGKNDMLDHEWVLLTFGSTSTCCCR